MECTNAWVRVLRKCSYGLPLSAFLNAFKIYWTGKQTIAPNALVHAISSLQVNLYGKNAKRPAQIAVPGRWGICKIHGLGLGRLEENVLVYKCGLYCAEGKSVSMYNKNSGTLTSNAACCPLALKSCW